MEVTKPELKFFLVKYGIKVTNWERTRKDELYGNIIGEWNTIRSKLGLVTNVKYSMYFELMQVVVRLGNHFQNNWTQLGTGPSSNINVALKVIQRFWRRCHGIQYKNIKAKFVFV